MNIADMLLPEFDHETAVTRQLLELSPEARLEWAPHPKSWTLGQLGVHLAQLPMWGREILTRPEVDLNPPGGVPLPRARFESKEATLRLFDEHVRQARQTLAGSSTAELLARWTLRDGGHVVFVMPRVTALRSFVFSHMIHHRGQLTVYLRLCDVPLPPIYGPTADT